MVVSAFHLSVLSLSFACRIADSQVLAVGDAQGDLHLLDIPRNLRRKMLGEEDMMDKFYQREIDRVNFYKAQASLPQPVDPTAKTAGDKKKRREEDEVRSPPLPASISIMPLTDSVCVQDPKLKVADGVDDKEEAEYAKQLAKFRVDLGLDTTE